MILDRVPISQLPSRYGIARSNLYTRLKDLGIEPEKEGKRAYVNASQLQLLDALHSHLQKGGITSEFLKQRESEPSRQNQALVAESTEQISLFQPSALVAVVETIVKRLVPTTGSRLSYLRELEEANERGWLLSTSEVASLLGLSPKTIREYGKEFEDAGFVFTRAGTRKGGEIAWAIGKKEEQAVPLKTSAFSIKEAFSSDYDPVEPHKS